MVIEKKLNGILNEQLIIKKINMTTDLIYKLGKMYDKDGIIPLSYGSGKTVRKLGGLSNTTRETVTHSIPSEEEKERVIQEFLSSSKVLNNDSPSYILFDKRVALASIKRDVSSVVFVMHPDDEIKKVAIEEAKKQGYVIDSKTPNFFLKNPELIIMSIRRSISSVDSIPFSYFTDEIKQIAIEEALHQHYKLTQKSPLFLRNNIQVVLESIKLDIKTALYISEEALKNYEVCKYLLFNGYTSFSNFISMPLALLKDEDILYYYLKKMEMTFDESSFPEVKVYNERVREIAIGLIHTPLLEKNLEPVFRMVAEQEWNSYKASQNDYFTNILNRICGALEQDNNFMHAIVELKFLLKIDDVLDENNNRYALYDALIKYHKICHNPKITDKTELLQTQRDIIAKYAALYISKSKEEYIQEKMEEYRTAFKKYFELKMDNPIVRKKIIEVKQREHLRKLYNENNQQIMVKIDAIKAQFAGVNNEIIQTILDSIIIDGTSNVEKIYKKPSRFDEYEQFEAASKIINRLNNHFIEYDSQEVDKYRNLIQYVGNRYEYTGDNFEQEEIDSFTSYKKLIELFNRLRTEVIKIAKSIEDYGTITKEDINKIKEECSFNDENYRFSLGNFLESIPIESLNMIMNIFEGYRYKITNDIDYQSIYNLFVQNNLFQLILLNDFFLYLDNDDNKIASKFNKAGICCNSMMELIENISKLIEMMKGNLSINNISELMDLMYILKCADLRQIALLGQDVVKKIYQNDTFINESSKEKRIKVASELMLAMAQRTTSTIPYINGACGNYKYSMYGTDDETLLTAGIDTGACFRVLGVDNDFLHYCALDKNGFVIKLTDRDNNFIGRASGFRNGNVVYINQLRTVYDKKSSAYQSEQKDIIAAFTAACQEIINISQNNPNEPQKIEFVIVTKSYLLDGYPSVVIPSVADAIGRKPMENSSEDWRQFQKTPNLQEASREDRFITDFGNYPLICMASSNGEIRQEKIHSGDIPAVYERKRNDIIISNTMNIEIEKKINRIRALHSLMGKSEFSFVKVSEPSKILVGDNWYAIYVDGEIVDSCCLPFDEIAKRELEVSVDAIDNKVTVHQR